MTQLQIGVIDAAKKRSRLAVNVDPAIPDADLTTLRGALAGVSIGTFDDSYLVERTKKDLGAKTAPANQFAQRTTRFLVTVQDDTTAETEQFTIACADLDQLVPGTHTLDVGVGTPGETLKTEIEAKVKSSAGNSVTYIDAIEVSRSGQ